MIGRIVAQYQIVGELGRGGMGIVYRAVDVKLDRDVALKFLSTFHADDPVSKKRFIREAKAASALDHPNICSVYELGETDDGYLFIAMPLYSGETLAEMMASGRLPAATVSSFARQIAAGLSKAHAVGVVHRDLKPANVFVTTDGVVKILDFGLATASDASRLTRENSTMGTPAYMSPEQARGEEVDHRTDLWSLGVILFESITGRRPFPTDYEHAALYAIVNEDPIRPEEIDQLAPEMGPVVRRLLQKDPTTRYPDAQSLLVELETGGRAPSLPESPSHPATPQSSSNRTGSTKWYSVGRLGWATVLIALAGLMIWRFTSQPGQAGRADPELELALATQEYFQGNYESASTRLVAIARKTDNSLADRRLALEFLAELQLEAGDTLAARTAVSDLLDLEPPLIMIAPHEATTVLGSIYDQERKKRISNRDQPSDASRIDALAILPFQEFHHIPAMGEVGSGLAGLFVAEIAAAAPSIHIVERERVDILLGQQLSQAEEFGYTPALFDWSEFSWNDPLPTGARPFVVWSEVEAGLPASSMRASHYLTGSILIEGNALDSSARILISAWMFDVKSARLDAWALHYGTMDQWREVAQTVVRDLVGRIRESAEGGT